MHAIGLPASGGAFVPALTDREREALRQQSHPLHGDLGSVDPLDVSRLVDECHRLLHPDQNARTSSLEILCSDMRIVRNVVCGGETAFRLVELGEAQEQDKHGGGRRGTSPASTSGRRLAGLLAAIVDTYFDADNCSGTKDEAISMLLEDENVSLLAKTRRITCQVVVNACSSSPRWRSSIAAALFPKRYTCLALTDDVRVVGSLAYSLHTMINIDDVDLTDSSQFRMERVVQLLALMLQVEARYGIAAGDGVPSETAGDRGGGNDGGNNGENDGENKGGNNSGQAGTGASADASLEILLTHLCLRRGALGEVVRGLCFGELAETSDGQVLAEDTNTNKIDAIRLNSNHVYLLDALVAGAANDPLPLPDEALSNLGDLMEQLWQSADGSQENNAIKSIVLRGCLHLWRDAMARESNVSSATVSAVFPTLLDMLRRDAHIADVLSVIANACHRRPAIQECLLGTHRGRGNDQGTTTTTTTTTTTSASGSGTARSHDTLCLILSHARGNPDAPLAREWALLAVRNLCECSQDARDAIQALEKVESAAGVGQTLNGSNPKYKVEYDETAGGWKLGVEQ